MSYDNFSADPRRLAGGFLRAAMGRGTRLYAPVEVTDVRATRRAVEAGTKGGPTIRCEALVFATGYEMPKVVRTKTHRIFSTFAIATEPQPRALWPSRCFIWEASDPYLYMRVSPDHRVICGGEDEKFSDEEARDALLLPKKVTLERKLKAMFPQLDTRAEFAWCGSFGSSTTGMPTIGAIPRTSELLRRHGLWRQRHHLLDDGGADAARLDHGRRRPRHRPRLPIKGRILFSGEKYASPNSVSCGP